jgi:hypothetical protein
MTLQASASKSELLLQCARPFEEGITTDDSPGEPALYGSAYHELMEFPSARVEKLLPLAIKLEKKWNIPGASDELVGHVRASKALLRKWMAGENPWNIAFSSGKVEKEIAFGINPSALTVRRIDLPSVEDHVYRGIDPSVEIPGTVDLMSNFPLVMDYKTGRDPFDFYTVPEDVTQLRTLGLAVWLENFHSPAASSPDAEVVLAVLHAPRGSVPAIYADAVPVADLRKHAERLADALRRKGDGSLRAGPACRLCPARYDCVTQTGSFLKAAAGAMELATPGGTLMAEIIEYGREAGVLATGEDVGRLHYFRKQFAKLDKAAGALEKAWVADHPDEVAVCPDGKLLVLKERSYEQLSKASIIRALGKARGEALIAALRENGVIETSERVELHAVDDK